MGEIYCLYASNEGIPRYVGKTEGSSDKRWKKHLTAALELEAGDLYEWIRNVIKAGGYVGHHILQTDVNPVDLDLYEQYWISQFSNLFNIKRKNLPKNEKQEIAGRVIGAIRLELEKQESVGDK